MTDLPPELAELSVGPIAYAVGPTTPELVSRQVGQLGAVTADDVALVVLAVNDFVAGLPAADPVHAEAAQLTQVDGETAAVWPARLTLGATMLGSRLIKRRNSPDGVAAFGDEGAVYVQRNDPDVALLLGLGSHRRPAVG